MKKYFGINLNDIPPKIFIYITINLGDKYNNIITISRKSKIKMNYMYFYLFIYLFKSVVLVF